jgi:hypothetical protein
VPGTNRSVTVKIASFVPPAPPTPTEEATSTESVPGSRLTLPENAPVGSAVSVVIDVVGAEAPIAVPVTATSTVAPGAVVPPTVAEAASTVIDGRVRLVGTSPPLTASGAVTLSGAAAGPLPDAESAYRAATIDGCSCRLPDAISAIRRSSCACAQVSGAADPSGWPSTNPIDAVVGSDPYGDAGTPG